MKAVVVTGASGFLGGTLCRAAAQRWHAARLVAIRSPRRGGLDLTAAAAHERLAQAVGRLEDPAATVLVHAAASLAWDEPAGLLDNAAMAVATARWARDAGVGFSVLVSSVSVLSADRPAEGQARPGSLYGLGKATAEEVWRLFLQPEQRAVVRLAGVWGWQERPTMFWNRALRAAAGLDGEPIVATQGATARNYISTDEACECLLGVAAHRMSGTWLAAGQDTVSLKHFIDAVQALPQSRLKARWQDDGQGEARVYPSSPELRRWLRPFPERLAQLWAQRPAAGA